MFSPENEHMFQIARIEGKQEKKKIARGGIEVESPTYKIRYFTQQGGIFKQAVGQSRHDVGTCADVDILLGPISLREDGRLSTERLRTIIQLAAAEYRHQHIAISTRRKHKAK